MNGGKRHRVSGACALALGLAMAGCTAVRTTDPPRTATEQFLLTEAAVLAVEQLAIEPLRGRKVHVDATYFAAPEKEFVVGELRAHLLLSGARLAPTAEEAEVILEVRSGGVGIDRNEFLLGIPALLIPSMATGGATGVAPLVTPELALVKNSRQLGFASVAFVAYWADTHEVITASGPFVGRTYRKDWWVFGSGPRTFGNIPPAQLEP